MNQKPISPDLLPGVLLKDLHSMRCLCGCEIFIPVSRTFLASRFQSAKGIPTLVAVPGGFACSKCGKINQFDPEGIEELKQPQTGVLQ